MYNITDARSDAHPKPNTYSRRDSRSSLVGVGGV